VCIEVSHLDFCRVTTQASNAMFAFDCFLIYRAHGDVKSHTNFIIIIRESNTPMTSDILASKTRPLIDHTLTEDSAI
jgi:hypothetical protein